MKQTFYVKLAKFAFMAYQGAEPLPEAVTVEALQRKVTPGVVEREDKTDVTVVDDKGKERREVQIRRSRQRVTRQTIGHPVLREWLAVEAGSPAEAEALFRTAMGGRANRPLRSMGPDSVCTVTTTPPEAKMAKAGRVLGPVNSAAEAAPV